MIFCSPPGMYGVVCTDALMFFTLLAIPFVISPLLIGPAGFDHIRATGERLPDYRTWVGADDREPGWSISQFMVWILFFVFTPAWVSRVLSIKNGRSARAIFTGIPRGALLS